MPTKVYKRLVTQAVLHLVFQILKNFSAERLKINYDDRNEALMGIPR